MTKKHWVLILLLSLATFAAGFFAAYLILDGYGAKQFAIREYDQRYEFIRPLLICQANEEEETREFSSLERQVNSVIAAAKREGKVTSASVYFRDLNSGRWVGVNELETYSPASLLKVPIMMAYFKASEDDPTILETRYRYNRKGEEADPLVKDPLLLENRTYTALDLIRGMIVQSDNPAKDILEQNADVTSVFETYSALEINNPYDTDDELYKLSAKKYGLFFRVLYNGTFLNREMSNQALALLSESEFDLGLRAGTPTNIRVAHKHGVHGFTQDDGSHGVEVSDCGIIYNSSSPYLLCVMSLGTNAYVLSDVIKDIAETVYQAVIRE